MTEDITEAELPEQPLREIEVHFRQIVEKSRDVIWIVSGDGARLLFLNRAGEVVTGRRYESFCADLPDLPDMIHPEDRTQAVAGLTAQVLGASEEDIEFRITRTDGAVRWLRTRAFAIRDGSGAICRIAGSSQDITDAKDAAQSLHRISGRLIQVQDEERRRIARELHDSTAQSLAALSMNLEALNDSAPEFSPGVRHALAESISLATECLREIRTLSYLLHPPQPDDFGLASALRWYVAGFAKRSGIEVQLVAPAELPRLPQDVEMTLFRIVQESLSNIHRHSGSSTAVIRVQLDPQQAALEVQDQGRGIPAEILENLNKSPADLGVGIAGMRERVGQLGGWLEIRSDAHGTSLRASLPVGRIHS